MLTMACGAIVLVDADVLEWASKLKWCLSAGYPSRRINGSISYLHWEVIGRPATGLVTDHINRNKLDNRRENLRHVTQMENMQNSKRALSRVGISIDRRHNRWKAYIDRPGHKRINVGTFKSEAEARFALESAR